MRASSNIGGQAVLEGIMMRNGDEYAVAVRKSDGTIALKKADCKNIFPKGVRKIPILRGMAAFIDSLVTGVSSLMWSAEFAIDEEEETGEKKAVSGTDAQVQKESVSRADAQDEKKAAGQSPAEEKSDGDGWGLEMTITLLIAIAFSVGLFMVLPYVLASLLRRVGVGEVGVSLAEALLRIGIFLLYMIAISRMKDIQRTFAYHGAEHKCINCIESGLDLTVENVMKSSRRHKRCGTSFLLIVVVISVIFFLIIGLLGITSPVLRFALRILMVPLIAGVSYEFLRLAAVSDHPVVCALAAPGLKLQSFVTREPDEQMTEVAIEAVNAVFDWKEWQGK